jgi:hypothetical protein
MRWVFKLKIKAVFISLFFAMISLSGCSEDDLGPAMVLDLYERGSSQNNVYRVEKHDPEADDGHCISFREFTSNGQIVRSMNSAHSDPLIDVESGALRDLKRRAKGLVMSPEPEGEIALELRLWADDHQSAQVGFLRADDPASAAFMSRVKQVCKMSWSAPQ